MLIERYIKGAKIILAYDFAGICAPKTVIIITIVIITHANDTLELITDNKIKIKENSTFLYGLNSANLLV
jgi:hypothetical protein